MACRCTRRSLLCVLGLLLTPITPLAQALPCQPIKRRSCTSPSAANTSWPAQRAFGTSPSVPWWWCRLQRKRVSDDFPGVSIEERLWQCSRIAGALSVDAWRGLSIPVRCVICTMWFSALCLQKLLVVFVGPSEMLVWIDVAHVWTEGARKLSLCSALHCAAWR